MSELSPYTPPEALMPVTPEAPPLMTASPEQLQRLRAMKGDALAGLDNLLVASAGDSLRASAVADTLTLGLQEALESDPDAFGLVGGYRGPVAEIARHAGDVVNSQTGHSAGDVYYLGGGNETVEDAQRVLTAARGRIADRRWDGTHHGARKAHAITAHRRKAVAHEALRGLETIAAQRGQVSITEATAHSILDALTKPVDR